MERSDITYRTLQLSTRLKKQTHKSYNMLKTFFASLQYCSNLPGEHMGPNMTSTLWSRSKCIAPMDPSLVTFSVHTFSTPALIGA